MKRSIDPVLTVAKAATATVLILVLASPAWAETTVKSSKSNSSDRLNSQPTADVTVPLTERKAIAIKTAEFTCALTIDEAGVKRQILLSKPTTKEQCDAARKSYYESRSNTANRGVPQVGLGVAGNKSKPAHDTALNSIRNLK